MPDVVTFDGPNKRIIEIDASGDNELDFVEIYSEWKTWVATGDNSKYLQAISQIGGDPISPTQNLGTTFFLENGWRIRPAESSHKFVIVGNVFTREPGESVFVDTLGAFTVNTETRVSNLVDSSVARLDLAQLLQAVYIDPINGTAGTADGVGTPTQPSSNITDARIIADRDNLQGYSMRGTHAITADHENWAFFGSSAGFADVVNISGVSVESSRFENMVITGTLSGKIEAVQSTLDILTGMDGIFRRCGLTGVLTVASDGDVVLDSCYSEVAGTATPIISMGTNSTCSLRNYSGGIEIRGMTAGCNVSVDLDPGRVIMTHPSNTGGVLLIRGTGNSLIDEGLGVTVIETGLVDTDLLYSGLQAMIGNVSVSGDDLTIEIKDTDNVTVLRTLSVSADGRIRSIA